MRLTIFEAKEVGLFQIPFHPGEPILFAIFWFSFILAVCVQILLCKKYSSIKRWCFLLFSLVGLLICEIGCQVITGWNRLAWMLFWFIFLTFLLGSGIYTLIYLIKKKKERPLWIDLHIWTEYFWLQYLSLWSAIFSFPGDHILMHGISSFSQFLPVLCRFNSAAYFIWKSWKFFLLSLPQHFLFAIYLFWNILLTWNLNYLPFAVWSSVYFFTIITKNNFDLSGIQRGFSLYFSYLSKKVIY